MFEALALEVITSVRDFVSRSVGPIASRLDDLDRRLVAIAAAPAPREGQDGKNVDPEDVRRMVDAEVTRAVAALPAPLAIQPTDILPTVRAWFDQAIGTMAPAKDGIDGTSVTLDDVLPALRAATDSFLASLPTPKDGKSLTIEDIRPYFEAEQAKWALDFERRAQDVLARAVASIPKPKDGVDGFGLEDVDFALADDGRTLISTFSRGHLVKRFEHRLDIVLDTGVYSPEKSYVKGDAASFGGSLFIAQQDDPGKPEAGDGWRLAVKRGRDGKDGVLLPPKPQGPVRL